MRRLKFVDVAKGIGMICIILGHLGRPEINHVVFSFHVPLFFLISGYFFKPAKGALGLAKRARRLLVPYVYCAAVCCAGKGVVACLKGGNQGSWSVVADSFVRALYGSGTPSSPLMGIKSFGAIWFLLALFWALCIYDELFEHGHLTLLVIVCFAVGYLTKGFWLPFSIQAGMCGVLFVHIGSAFRRFLETRQDTLARGALIGVLPFCLLIWIVAYAIDGGQLFLVKNYFKCVPLDVAGAVAGTALVLAASICLARIPVLSSGLEVFGRYSLTVLCFHMFDLAVIPWSDILNAMGISPNAASSWKSCLVLALLKLAWAFLGACTALLLHMSKTAGQEVPDDCFDASTKSRIGYFDIAKGLAIVLVIMAHQAFVDPSFRKLAFSFHMPLFFLLNACFIGSSYNVKRTFFRSCKSLLVPYMTACVLSALLKALVTPEQTKAAFMGRIVSMLGGMSKTGVVFQNLESVWLVWFVACLFIARNVYVLSRYLTRGAPLVVQRAVPATLCLIGWFLGKSGVFLPWSIDVALYAQAFYFVGDEARRMGVLNRRPSLQTLLLLISLWIALALGGYQIEMATRSYPGLIMCGACACLGSLVALYASRAIDVCLRPAMSFLSRFLSWVGRNSMVILIVHCLRMMWTQWTGGKAFFESVPWWHNAFFEVVFCLVVTFCFVRARQCVRAVYSRRLICPSVSSR